MLVFPYTSGRSPPALEGLIQKVGSRFDPKLVQTFFDMIKTEKSILKTEESVDSCLVLLTQNIERLADQNRIEKKLGNPFSSFFKYQAAWIHDPIGI